MHGSILTLKCFDERCTYIDPINASDPLCPALAPAAIDYPPDQPIPLLDPSSPLPKIDPADLPHCPQCKTSLLRPGVVWFGEALDTAMMAGVDSWIGRRSDSTKVIDVMLVVGTAAAVWPAAGYVEKARRRGAVVVVVNPDPEAAEDLEDEDFWFGGDAAEVLPRLFEGVIGEIR